MICGQHRQRKSKMSKIEKVTRLSRGQSQTGQTVMSGSSATTTGEAEPRGRSRTRRSVKRPRLLKDFVTDISPERGISAGMTTKH